ncbi:nuclear pore complex protein NUP88-like [Pyrus communis]|uniref:nuclear pore complex protein NUP88-like n=1 Tax=Pyrus communis TaxID=23211 RepID=UPI0035BF1774
MSKLSPPSLAITCELDQPLDSTLWLGLPPLLSRLATVDLALPRKAKSGSLIRMFTYPLMLERINTLHDGGLDSIVLHYLPFTSHISGKNQTMRTPSVHPVLSTCQGDDPSQSPLSGFVSLSDSFGCSWIVGLTVLQEFIVLEVKAWYLLLPLQVDMENNFLCLEGPNEKYMPNLISKELLVGLKVVLLPQSSPRLRSLSADSIEGRPKLHEYFRSFHEYYAEYAHKHARLGDAQQRLSQV